jgi:hypothetical protein
MIKNKEKDYTKERINNRRFFKTGRENGGT